MPWDVQTTRFLSGCFDCDVCEITEGKWRARRRRGYSLVNGLPIVLGLCDPYFVKISLIISRRK